MSLDGLTREQADAVLRFLLYRMDLDTRGALMAELPVAYARLYPSVSPTTVIERVGNALNGADK